MFLGVFKPPRQKFVKIFDTPPKEGNFSQFPHLASSLKHLQLQINIFSEEFFRNFLKVFGNVRKVEMIAWIRIVFVEQVVFFQNHFQLTRHNIGWIDDTDAVSIILFNFVNQKRIMRTT